MATKIPAFKTEEEARAFLESVRWPNGPVCPHCGSEGGWSVKTKDYMRKDKDGNALRVQKARQGLYKCAQYKCGEQFSVTVGTIFERSHIPLTIWLKAVQLMVSSKKGISSHQLHRMLGVQYKTAWFLSHRLREAMKDGSGTLLGGPGSSGIVEADETYFGKVEGQGSGTHRSKKQKVVALVERNGRVRAFHVPTVTAASLKPILESQIAQSARLMTDSAPVYSKIGKHFATHRNGQPSCRRIRAWRCNH